MPGHITGSAWVTDQNRKQVVLVHHRKLDIWVQPGGHCDGQSDVLESARREVLEETGLQPQTLNEGAIFDLDIHQIPAGKNQPEHWHYDVRYLLEADAKHPLLLSEESHDLRWVALDSLNQYSREISLFRMREKLGSLAETLPE